MEADTIAEYLGRPLSEMTTQQLIEIILELDTKIRQQAEQHLGDLNFITGYNR